MSELCSEYLSVRCIWLYVFVMSRTRFRVNPLNKSNDDGRLILIRVGFLGASFVEGGGVGGTTCLKLFRIMIKT